VCAFSGQAEEDCRWSECGDDGDYGDYNGGGVLNRGLSHSGIVLLPMSHAVAARDTRNGSRSTFGVNAGLKFPKSAD
jgi:hypothetical protein